MKRLFVTGTDTEVGKTFIAQKILREFANAQQRVVGFKPIASGCDVTEQGLRNEDALALQGNSSVELPYANVNPFAFEEAIAPHIAARNTHTLLDVSCINDAYEQLYQFHPDCIVTEGAGGWRLPLGNGQFMSEFAVQQKMSVVLVIGLRLGCLNHARLTAEAILRDGLSIVGWVANQVDPNMPYQQDNLATLQEQLMCDFDTRCLGFQPWQSADSDNANATNTLDLSGLI